MKNKETRGRQAFLKPLILVFLLIAAYLSVSVMKQSLSSHRLDSQIEVLKKEIEDQQKRNTQLMENLEYLQKDSYIEKQAREKFNLAKPGEKVVIIGKSSSKGGVAAALSDNSDYENRANPMKWWDYIMKNK